MTAVIPVRQLKNRRPCLMANKLNLITTRHCIDIRVTWMAYL
jgi:hypothetical protein